MKLISHWTPKYIFNRIDLFFYEKAHPDHPWLTSRAIWLLENLLRPGDVGLEWGAGRSTIWLSKRVTRLTSIEHDPNWAEKVSKQLKDAQITNVTLLFIKEYAKGIEEEDRCRNFGPYVKEVENFPESSLDFVLVDGIYRCGCANLVINKIRPGGILILDNANWYLPGSSSAPGSKKNQKDSIAPGWMEFMQKVQSWRCIWTSNGVTDTVLWFKPD